MNFICCKIIFVKIFFKTLFIFLCFLFLQGLNCQESPQELASHVNYIQNGYQKVVLSSEIMRGSEICITQNSDNSNSFGGRTHAAVLSQSSNPLYSKVRPVQTGDFIHNLSTSFSTEILVRAP